MIGLSCSDDVDGSCADPRETEVSEEEGESEGVELNAIKSSSHL